MLAIKKQFNSLPLALFLILSTILMPTSELNSQQNKNIVRLPKPQTKGKISVEEAIAQRRSTRNFQNKSISLHHVSQLLWSAQGVTHGDGLRTAPSAGALYPLEIYVVAANVTDLEPGIYRYMPHDHTLFMTMPGEILNKVVAAALHQDWMENASALIIFSAIYERTTGKYGNRGMRYVHMEVGYAGENLFLQCESLGLSTVVVGAFNDERVKDVLKLNENEHPLSIMPVGYKK